MHGGGNIVKNGKGIIRDVQVLSHELIDGSDNRRKFVAVLAQTSDATMTVHAYIEFPSL